MVEEILQQLRAELEEFGDIHDKNCGTYNEDECDCLMLKNIMADCRVALQKLNNYWLTHLLAHRPYCSPTGNKMLTQIKKKTIAQSKT